MAVVVSAPGKVLMTGGYLILERPNAGLVLSTTARFYAIVKPLYEEMKPDSKSWAWAWTDVKVRSPQLYREADYKLSLTNSELRIVSSRESANPFVEQAVQYAVAAAQVIHTDKGSNDIIHKLLLQGLDITILGSNDFYSYRRLIEARGLPLSPEVLASLPPFSSITFNTNELSGEDLGVNCKPEVAKTGLGSSAAMTTAVVAAILHYLQVANLPVSSKATQGEKVTGSELDLVHIVAQSAHCMAQGKVGSGFDVSSAVYGCQRYVRFSPEVLSAAQAGVGGRSLHMIISDILKGKWDHEKSHFSLPPLMTLLLGEPGTGGSATPSLVGAVKQWQKSDPQGSLETWKRLGEANSKLEVQLKLLKKIAEEQFETYKYIIGSCSHHTPEKWMEQAADLCQESIVKSLLGAREAILEIRSYMQKMGKAAGVPIEPESQTQLVDATMSMEGVLLAGVPGAGGFDAIYAITLGESGTNVAKAWSSLGVLPMLVREDAEGVHLESDDPRAKEISSGISSVHIE
ncbi:phosphomevalonate kinase, peroxisomal [Aristolochia californica]|uniref:phosphomevalonate kinase, peroxisomal n=1 Tax=Aristolochia californica TaxID=171875 RepID=UPI0035E03E53